MKDLDSLSAGAIFLKREYSIADSELKSFLKGGFDK